MPYDEPDVELGCCFIAAIVAVVILIPLLLYIIR